MFRLVASIVYLLIVDCSIEKVLRNMHRLLGFNTHQYARYRHRKILIFWYSHISDQLCVRLSFYLNCVQRNHIFSEKKHIFKIEVNNAFFQHNVNFKVI